MPRKQIDRERIKKEVADARKRIEAIPAADRLKPPAELSSIGMQQTREQIPPPDDYEIWGMGDGSGRVAVTIGCGDRGFQWFTIEEAKQLADRLKNPDGIQAVSFFGVDLSDEQRRALADVLNHLCGQELQAGFAKAIKEMHEIGQEWDAFIEHQLAKNNVK